MEPERGERESRLPEGVRLREALCVTRPLLKGGSAMGTMLKPQSDEAATCCFAFPLITRESRLYVRVQRSGWITLLKINLRRLSHAAYLHSPLQRIIIAFTVASSCMVREFAQISISDISPL